jgi:choline dehydrogenase
MSPLHGAGLLWRYVTRREGQLSYVLPAIAFAKTRPDLADPDVQFHFAEFGSQIVDGSAVLLQSAAATIQCNVNRTRSRGWLELRSPDPFAPPVIHANLLSDDTDLQTLIAGARLARRAFQTTALSKFVIAEHAPGGDVVSDSDWARFIRDNASIEYHPCGTCRMGADANSVVDSNLKVRGVENLRVADASIIPQIPSANINAITLVIGEKASRFILAVL